MCLEGTAQSRERLQHTPCMEETLHPFLKQVRSLSTLHTVSLHCTRPRRGERFFSLYKGLELGLSPILLAVECLVR